MQRTIGLLAALPILVASVCSEAADDPVANLFGQLDADRDGQLSAVEYLLRPGRREVHLRDLKLFDFDGDGQLSRSEMAAIPGLGPRHLRGALPDPFDELLEVAQAALDQSYNEWDQHPDSRIPINHFVDVHLQSVGLPRHSLADVAIRQQADANQDDEVSRTEARRFLRMQLGMELQDGSLARLPNGRVRHWRQFDWFDLNADGGLTLNEYSDRIGGRAEAEFLAGDFNQDRVVVWDEFYSPRCPSGHDDPVGWFRWSDKNFDAVLDIDEMTSTTPDWRRPVLKLVFPAWDENGDGRLDLNEYRLSPAGNYLCSWETAREDTNRDGRLSFEEFLFEPNFILLQRLYFSRLDRNGDGVLSDGELLPEPPRPTGLYALSIASGELRPIFIGNQTLSLSQPDVSPDGSRIAWSVGVGPRGPAQDDETLSVHVKGGVPEYMGRGRAPRWSPDGTQLLVVRDGGEDAELWTIQVDSGHAERIVEQARGAAWSPDGMSIYFLRDQGIWRFDLGTQSAVEPLPPLAGYRGVGRSLCVSPDGKRIYCIGLRERVQNKAKHDLLSISTDHDGPGLQVHNRDLLWASVGVAIAPDGGELFLSCYSLEHLRVVNHRIDLARNSTLHPLPGEQLRLHSNGCCLGPDGDTLYFVTYPAKDDAN